MLWSGRRHRRPRQRLVAGVGTLSYSGDTGHAVPTGPVHWGVVDDRVADTWRIRTREQLVHREPGNSRIANDTWRFNARAEAIGRLSRCDGRAGAGEVLRVGQGVQGDWRFD